RGGVPELTGPDGGRIPTREVGAAIAAATGLGRRHSLVRLPDRIALRDILTATALTDDVPFAIGESALQPVVLATRQVPNLLVVGRQGCGKTTTLAAIGQAVSARMTPEQAQLTIIDPKTTLIGTIQGPCVRAYAYTPEDIDRVIAELAALVSDRLPPSGLTQEQLLARASWHGPRHFVLIDDEQELRPATPAGRDRAAVDADRAQPGDRPARHRHQAAGQLGRRLGDEPADRETRGFAGIHAVHGQRPGDQGLRADRRAAVSAGPGPAGQHRGCDGDDPGRRAGAGLGSAKLAQPAVVDLLF
ncbi:MAG: hypothetical protein EBU54_09015, partial [Mycobacteriaceae bacterium]|nr:hypothetical protein [Mycobacteriaceae bacterium]